MLTHVQGSSQVTLHFLCSHITSRGVAGNHLNFQGPQTTELFDSNHRTVRIYSAHKGHGRFELVTIGFKADSLSPCANYLGPRYLLKIIYYYGETVLHRILLCDS